MPKKIKNFDVYELIVRDEYDNIIPFETIIGNQLDKYEPVYEEGSQIFLYKKDMSRKLYLGTMGYIKMMDLPNKANSITQKFEPLNFDETEGLGLMSSFLFDPDLQMLAFESNTNNISLKTFCDFFERNYSLPPIETRIVIDPTEMEKLDRMGIVKKFEIKIAKVRNGSVFKTKKEQAVGEFIDIAKRTNSNILTCVMTAGRKKNNSLSLELVKEMLTEFLSFKSRKEVPILQITGKETEDGKTDFINFVSNKVRVSIKMEPVRFTDMALQIKYQLLEQEYINVKQSQLKGYKEQKD